MSSRVKPSLSMMSSSLFLCREYLTSCLTLAFSWLSCSDGSYPTVSSHNGEWSLNPSTHSLTWSIPLISADERTGSLMFTVGGDDPGTFFPVHVTFAGQGSLAGVVVGGIKNTTTGEIEEVYSVDSIVEVEEYSVV